MPTDPTRRDFLRTAAAGAAVVGTTGLHPGLAAPLTPAGSAKACIFINLVGGPSHLDTFDPKPHAAAEVRGPFAPIPTRVPGVYLSELFPKLAGLADKFSLIRSMHHDAPPIHEAGLQLNNTGRLFRDGPAWPNTGAVVAHLSGRRDNGLAWWRMPGHDIDTGIRVGHGQDRGFLDVPLCEDGRASTFRDACHFAAYVVFNGARFVTINQFPTVFDAPSWDCHADRGSLNTTLDDYRATVAPSFDAAFSALLTDLDDRGLLDTTLVVAVGEFGRTPRLNANGGRDHWAGCWTALVAGGGVKGGRVVGRSDATGSEPADRPVTPPELVATVFHALGVPGSATMPGPDGAPVAVYPARPVTELF
ncbi:DUF1501 domain-containing protein [Urbifossiella limnaea]|uniref:DUF1501 domain-containing protein n=1 Tax=Urbifossiella limnaea TaxID=2528023 RepID=A0A517XZZ1_9BACT|nr:DUF1501 domain-containing protein [Urbifossiella limnaea]QDU23071.1 hypothetical protein ETAA1_50620 [Urbifossiella limnaea]